MSLAWRNDRVERPIELLVTGDGYNLSEEAGRRRRRMYY